MLRFLSSLLLCFLLYFHAGYFWVNIAQKARLESEVTAKINEEKFNQAETSLISLPISFPYRSNQEEFKSTQGKVNVDGKFYRIVKHRYYRDTLHIMYIKDEHLEELHQSLSDWVQTQTDQKNTPSGKDLVLKTIAKYYLLQKVIIPKSKSLKLMSQGHPPYLDSLQEIDLNVPNPPPKG